MNITMVPFGLAKVKWQPKGEYWEFSCQHGSGECYGNLVQTCALHIYSFPQALQFIVCMENSADTANSGPGCAAEQNLSYKTVKECIGSYEGNTYLYNNGQKTYNHNIHAVPWFSINGDDTNTNGIEDVALYNLLKVICNAYTGQKPSACNGS